MFIGLLGFCFEQITDSRDITQKWHLCLGIVLKQFKNTTNHDRAAILNQHLSLNVLCINSSYILKNFTWTVFIHIKIQNYVPFWRYLRQNFQLQDGLFKSNNCSAIWCGHGIRELSSLLY
ncbi:hypothetical protein ASE39_14185 [Acidovorax sp. Root267]|nr:hypothetical protein ASE39_14185 [Acidovorax sp. Root267]